MPTTRGRHSLKRSACAKCDDAVPILTSRRVEAGGRLKHNAAYQGEVVEFRAAVTCAARARSRSMGGGTGKARAGEPWVGTWGGQSPPPPVAPPPLSPPQTWWTPRNATSFSASAPVRQPSRPIRPACPRRCGSPHQRTPRRCPPKAMGPPSRHRPPAAGQSNPRSHPHSCPPR